ncbi:STAS domain-containing protein [Streptomyces sp. SID14478]|nr:STAS domain-containing protein [Streptomyces sp. SID14478]NEB74694.1 STAS domain-containing protein [Streptomyces sp. SID14478]
MDGDPRSLRIAPSAPLIEAYALGERTSVAVHGEIDIDVASSFHEALHAALDRSAAGLDLELESLRFCDCAGLRVLLQVRMEALEAGKTVRICSASPLVSRLLGITRTHALFDATPAKAAEAGRTPLDDAVPTQHAVFPPAANSHGGESTPGDTTGRQPKHSPGRTPPHPSTITPAKEATS